MKIQSDDTVAGVRLRAYDVVVEMRLRRLTGWRARRQARQLWTVVDYLLNTHIPQGVAVRVCRKCGTAWPCSVVTDIGELLPG